MGELKPSTVPHKLLREEIDERKCRWPGGKHGCKGCKARFAKDVAEVKDSWMGRSIDFVSASAPRPELASS